MEQVVACFNAGDFARLTSLFTDGYWRREVRGSVLVAQGFVDAAATPRSPAPAHQRERLVAVRDVRRLADGRVGAVVVLARPGDATPNADFVVFVRDSGRWLIDEVVADVGDRDGATPMSR